jgi:hypothetical protein
MTFQRERFLKCARGLLKLPPEHTFHYGYSYKDKTWAEGVLGLKCDSVGCVIGSLSVTNPDECKLLLDVDKRAYFFDIAGQQMHVSDYMRIGVVFFGITHYESDMLFSPHNDDKIPPALMPWGRHRLSMNATPRQLHSYMMAFYKWKVAQEEDSIRLQEQIEDDRRPRN